MNQDSVVGTAKNLGGKAQESVGRAMGDAKMQADGLINQAAGTAQELYGQVKDGASEAAEAVMQGAASAEDYVRQTIEKRPYTIAVVALCAGWLLGRIGRRGY